jgi:hypothetical protein
LRSISSLQRTVSTSPLVDISRASSSDLFEQPATRVFRQSKKFSGIITEGAGMAKIRAVVTEGDRQNGYKRVQVLFGINYFLEIVENDGQVEFLLGAHHTGFKADASEANGELQKYISEIQQRHPESAFEQE